MWYDPEDDLAALTPVAPRPQRGAESSLDHAVDGLRLPPLAVLRLEPGELLFHPPPPSPGRPLLRRPTPLRRDDRADAVGLPHPLVDPLGVEVGVRQERPDPRPPARILQRGAELSQVRP